MMKGKKDEIFPLVEAFGYCVNSSTEAAKKAKSDRACPFAGNKC